MMYYSIENRTDKEVGNIFPQTNCLTQMYAHQLHSDEFPSFTPKLHFELEKKAKLTDVLSQAAISAQGLLVNEKVKKVLSTHKLLKHKFYPASASTKNEVKTYFWLHLSENITNTINFQESVFYRTKSTFRKEKISITSFEDYKKQKKSNGILWGAETETIVTNSKFDKKLDLFTFPPFDYSLYISSILKDVLQQENITGININPVSNIL